MVAARWSRVPGLAVLVVLAVCAGYAGAQAPEVPAASPPAPETPTTVSAPPATEVVRGQAPGLVKSFVCNNEDIRRALRLLITQARPEDAKNIICTKEVAGTVTVDLKDVTFQEALQAILMVTGLACQEKDNFLCVMTRQQLADAQKAEKKLAVRMFRLAYVTAADAKSLIAKVLSPEGSADATPTALAGIDASKTTTGGNSLAVHDMLVVRDYEENLDAVARIIQEIDAKPDQVVIEVTILSAKLTEDNALGIDFSALGGVDFAKLSTVTDPADLQALTTGALANAGTNARAVRTGTTAGVGSGGISLGFFSDNVALFIKALETVTDVTVVANPKLLIVNKQRGEILIGDQRGYPNTTVQTETANTQSIAMLETGTRLIVRPYIAKDGFIRMEIHPEESTGDVTVKGTAVVPSKKTVETTSNVMVRDGHTIVIGGLFHESTTADRTQVPLLGNLPYLGTLFRQTKDTTLRDEIIFLITPRIVQQARDEAVSEQLKDDVERFRIGARKGVRWWGRDRLANCHVRQARQDLAEGRRTCALWNVDMALSLEPRMEEAIRLRERLTERAFWADESQFSSVQNVVQRMMMNELGKPTERMVTPGKPRDASAVDEDVREKFGMEPRIEDPLPGAWPPGTVRVTPPAPRTPATAPAPAASPMEGDPKEPVKE